MSSPIIAVDVGNTRSKWLYGQSFGLLDDDPQTWAASLVKIPQPARWVLAGSQPTRRDQLAEWATARGDEVQVLRDYRQLPIRLDVDFPERVGLDRLLSAIGAVRALGSDQRIVVVDAGTAVTVDLVDAGTFRGGVIMPGLRLMGQALHDHTATLPLVRDFSDVPPVPARHTVAAITAGAFWAVVGGVRAVLAEYSRDVAAAVVVTGGDGLAIHKALPETSQFEPWLTLQGIRASVAG